jgi:hypothetical protein
MDILTEKGQKTLIDEKVAIEIFLKNVSGYGIIETNKSKPSDFDFILTKDNETFAVAETKCRYDCDIHKFNSEYKSHWLITFDKLIKLKAICDSMKVDAIGFLYIVKSKSLLVKTIIHNGDFVIDFNVKNTYTKKSINGGNTLRTNAYIDMTNAKIFY